MKENTLNKKASKYIRSMIENETRASDSTPLFNPPPQIKITKDTPPDVNRQDRYVPPHGRSYSQNKGNGKNKYHGRSKSGRRDLNSGIIATPFVKQPRKEYTYGSKKEYPIDNANVKTWRQPNGPSVKGFNAKRCPETEVNKDCTTTKTKTGGLMAVVSKFQDKQKERSLSQIVTEQEPRLRSGSIPAAASLLGDIDANCYSSFEPVDCSSPKTVLPQHLQLNAFRKTPGASRPPGLEIFNKETIIGEQVDIPVTYITDHTSEHTVASHIGRSGDFGYSNKPALSTLPDTPTTLLPAGFIPDLSATPPTITAPKVVPHPPQTYASTLAISKSSSLTGSQIANSMHSSRSCSPCNFNNAEESQKSRDIVIPDHNESPPTLASLPPHQPIDVIVSNLDYNISGGEWKKILYSEFHQNVPVLNIRIHTQLDNTDIAVITVSDREDAMFAITHFHRKKIGYKRIHVNIMIPVKDNAIPSAMKSNGNVNITEMKRDVIDILSHVVGCTMPINMLCEFYQKRNRNTSTLSIVTLREMSDSVQIVENSTSGKNAVLLPSARSGSHFVDNDVEDVEEEQRIRWGCPQHASEDHRPSLLPDIRIDANVFSANVHSLLQSHNGNLMLSSFMQCYRNEFCNPDVNKSGVHIEHLISMISGLKIIKTIHSGKTIQWHDNKTPEGTPTGSPVTQQRSQQLCRDVIETLKMNTKCRVQLHEFSVAFSKVHGRECNLFDYGVSKVVDLLETIPHVVQILGETNHKVVTLTHRAQIKRFINDVRRVVKKQPNKRISIMNLSKQYTELHAREFNIGDYGVCFINDMLSDIPEGAFIIKNNGPDTEISIPHREQSLREIVKTKIFATEVGILFRCYRSNRGTCTMAFDRFIPHYHHQFSKQCRVSDYGFTKLIDLLEAIPQVIKIFEYRNEKTLFLIGPDLLKAYGEQIHMMLSSTIASHKLNIQELMASYKQTYACDIRLEDAGASSVIDLVNNLTKLTEFGLRFDGKCIVLTVHENEIDIMLSRVLRIIMDKTEDGRLSFSQLSEWYSATFFVPLMSLEQLVRHLKPHCDISNQYNETIISLNQTMLFARDLRLVLKTTDGKIAYQHFESAYQRYFGCTLAPQIYGFSSLLTLLRAVSRVAVIHGYGYQCNIVLTQDFVGLTINYYPVNNNARQQCCERHPSFNDTLSGDSNHKILGTPSSDSGIVEPKFHAKYDISIDDPFSKEASPVVNDFKGMKCSKSLTFEDKTMNIPSRTLSNNNLYDYAQNNPYNNEYNYKNPYHSSNIDSNDEMGSHFSQGHFSQGHTSQGHFSLGHSSQGHNSQGHNSQGHFSLGHNSQGHSSQSHSSQGHSSQSLSSQGHGSLGLSSLGHGSHGHTSQGLGSQGVDSQGHSLYRHATYPSNLNYEAEPNTCMSSMSSTTQSSSGFLDWPNRSNTWSPPASWSVGDDDFKPFNRNTNEDSSLPNSIDNLKISSDNWPSLSNSFEMRKDPSRRNRIAARFLA